MRRLAIRCLLLLFASLIGCQPVAAAIAYASNSGTTIVSSGNCAITATNNFTAGNVLLVFLSIRTTTSTASGVTAGSDALVKYGAVNNGTNIRNELWVDTSYAGGTSKTVTVTMAVGSKMTCAVVEYSGVSSLGVITSSTASVAANPTFQGLTTQDTNNFILVGFAGQGNGAFTNGTGCGTTSGAIRASNTTSGGSGSTNAGLGVCENSSATAATIFQQVTNADTIWQVIALELRSVNSSGTVQATNTSGGASVAIAFPFSNRVGNKIIACIKGNSANTMTVTDSAGNTYTAVTARVDQSGGSSIECFTVGSALASTANTVTCSNTSATAMTCELAELYGLSSAVDVSSTGNGASGTAATTSSLVLNFAPAELMVYGNQVLTWTGFGNGSFGSNATLIQFQHAAGCGTYAVSDSTATNWAVIGFSIKDTNGSASCVAGTQAPTLTLLGAGPGGE